MLKTVFHFLNVYLVCSNNKRKIKYLRKKGADFAEDVIIYSNIDAFGSEPYLISIGNKTTISSNVTFFTHDGGMRVLNNLNLFDSNVDKLGRIKIGNNCFVGARSIIMPGVVLGDNCIVGAGAVVTKSFQDNSVVAGVPAKIITDINGYYEKNKDKVHCTKDLTPSEKKDYCQKFLGE